MVRTLSFILSLILVLFTSTYSHAATSATDISDETQKYLENRIKKSDKRYFSFLTILKLLEQVEAKTLVETGTARYGDKNFESEGGSTIIFGDWAAQHDDCMLYSVDITSLSIGNAKNATKLYAEHIQFFCQDSLEFLEHFDQPIDFLYLDSYDFSAYDPEPSQAHHLQEIIAAYPLLHKKSIVMIDDCDLPFGGKGKLVIEYLLSQGWVIFSKGYQVILVREDFDF